MTMVAMGAKVIQFKELVNENHENMRSINHLRLYNLTDVTIPSFSKSDDEASVAFSPMPTVK